MLEEMKGEGDRIHVYIGRCDGLEQFHQVGSSPIRRKLLRPMACGAAIVSSTCLHT